MTLEIINAGIPLTLEEVVELENNLEVKLPADYVDFLTKYNGGEFEEEVDYPLIEPPPRGTGGFRYFHSVKRRNGELLLIEPPDMDIRDLYYIALDEAGSICLACSGAEYGKVYFVDSDRGVEHWFCLVANSFNEFLESIQPDSDDE